MSLATVCFALALTLYLVTRLVGLTDFPIYFLGDEAVQVVDAAQLAHHGLRDQFGTLLPTYLANGVFLNAGAFVYMQLIPYLLFGFSEYAARSVTAVATLTAAVAIALLLRDVFRVRFWWIGVPLLSIAPAWFLHSRTAFEAPAGASFYAWFLYLYLRFRTRGGAPALYGAVLAAGLASYTYTGLKLVVLATSVLFAVSDCRFLAARRRIVLRALLVAAVLAVPELRFNLEHPGAETFQLNQLNAWIVDPRLGVVAKLRRFFDEYTTGLSPGYWYDPHETRDLARHVMKGYGNLLPETLPLAALGVIRAFARLRQAPYRAILLATAAAPLGATVVRIELPRALVVVVPATILTALGLDALLVVLARRVPGWVLSVGMLGLLAAASVGMTVDALRNGPTWYTDYGLYGMQYGGPQVTAAMREELARHPRRRLALATDWANGTDNVVRFFLPGEPDVAVADAAGLIADRYPALGATTFVMPPGDVRRLRSSGLFEPPRIIRTVKAPDGTNAFLLFGLRYSPRAAAIFAAAREKRRRPITELATLRGVRTLVTHTPFDFGGVRDLFDGDTFTLAQTADANAMLIRLRFSVPQRLQRVRVVAAAMRLSVTASFTVVGRTEPVLVRRDVGARVDQPSVDLGLPRPSLVRTIALDIFDPTDHVNRHVHVREIELR